MSFRHAHRDPGPCPVCDAPHTTCTAPPVGAVSIPMLPARDGVVTPPLVGSLTTPSSVVGAVPPLVADVVQATLPSDEVTTGTYRKKQRSR